jgi:hypothetical protein
LTAVAAVLLATSAQAQTYPLAESPQPGDCSRLRLAMKLTGQMRVIQEEGEAKLKLSAQATHEFIERVLAVKDGLPDKAARVYEQAKADIRVEGDRSERGLRPERRLQVAQREGDRLLVYSPAGPLTREELELTSGHFDTLALAGLLPGKPVPVGQTWKLSDAVAQALCHFEGLTSQDLTAKLEEVKAGQARIGIRGSAAGIDLGAQVKLTVSATAHFDLTKSRLVSLEWSQKDERDQGPASPASTVETVISLQRQVIEQPSALSDPALVSVPDGEPPLPMLLLEYVDSRGHYALTCDRDWHMTGRTEHHLVLRLMDRGEFVAQLSVTEWQRAKPGEHLSGEEFQQQVTNIPGWEPAQIIQAGEVPLDGGRWCYRVCALGALDGLEVMQNFYLVAGPQGDQVALTFTLKPTLADKLGTRDLTVVGSIDFPSSRKPKE